MMKDNIYPPYPSIIRETAVVTVECKCPKCKRTFWKTVTSGYIDKNYMKKELCPKCKMNNSRKKNPSIFSKSKKKKSGIFKVF